MFVSFCCSDWAVNAEATAWRLDLSSARRSWRAFSSFPKLPALVFRALMAVVSPTRSSCGGNAPSRLRSSPGSDSSFRSSSGNDSSLRGVLERPRVSSLGSPVPGGTSPAAWGTVNGAIPSVTWVGVDVDVASGAETDGAAAPNGAASEDMAKKVWTRSISSDNPSSWNMLSPDKQTNST